MKKLLAQNGPVSSMRTISVLLLLLVYFVGSVQIESIHSIFHDVELALHSSEQEEDPCHRAIYHDAKDDACDHATHITAVKKCPLCHVVPFNDQHLPDQNSFRFFSSADTYFSEYFESGFKSAVTHLPARAPPVK